ncbi:acetate--CoA ligase family protein [Mycobacterium sp. 94-17]|uniref:acetate--CoA ligase family protein n=1 Tax=Mycobacterium sp. 94-17 TaxID=2986147 RepID=UPI002D1EFC53|nr:acetate--CoA ligase family protein [Mycobacterium sp. 94-17]MEB4209750.1 acetate--CoA ligase family protein [Mycobacterium sp. 94-17]
MTAGMDAAQAPVALRHVDWEALFAPKRAVFIGATDREGSQQRAQWLFFKERLEPLDCQVIPVHPTKAEILGTPAVTSVVDVDGDVDVACVLVRDVLPAVRDCVAKGVRFVIVFSAGFAELGTEEGIRAECELAALANDRTRIIGPNTNLNIFEPWRSDLPGKKLAIVTQSGFQGRPISQGQQYGIGIQSWATLGNEADLEWADFVKHYATLPDTGAIVTYVEGFKSGRTMMLAAESAAQHHVPIVAIKVGRSQEGQAMAQAHTGHLTGSDVVHDAAFEQSGVIRVDDFDEAIEISGLFCHAPRPTGTDGVAIYTLSGGTAAHLVDLCAAAGLPVPRFSEATVSALAQHIPAILRMDNPVDTGGTLTATPAGKATLEIVLADPKVNVVMIPITGVFPGMIEPLARDIVHLHATSTKPIVVVWMSPIRDNDGYRTLCAHGIPLFHSLTAAVLGVKSLLNHRTFVTSFESTQWMLSAPPLQFADRGRRMLAAAPTLDEVAAKELLRGYGIPCVEEYVAASAGEATRAVDRLGGLAVLKVLSPDIAHKSDLGLVRVGVTTAQAADAYQHLMNRAAEVAPAATLRGVVVQAMVTDPVAEAIVGISRQEPFGPVVMFGLGGIFVEVFADVAFGVPPFTRAWAERMVMGVRSAKLLSGARGRPRGDVGSVVNVLLNIQRLALDLGDDIAELDVNPLMVLPEGGGVVAVDGLVVSRRH